MCGDYDPHSDRYTIYTGLQNPHQLRQQLADEIFHLPETQFRVVADDIGGSFGMRGGTYHELPLVLWASRKVGRPVKWVCERSEGFVSDDHARDNVSDVELAVTEDGKFLGMRIRTLANMGAYLSIRGPHPPVGNLGTLAGPYTTEAIHVSVSGVFTNTNCTGPYRGAGGPRRPMSSNAWSNWRRPNSASIRSRSGAATISRPTRCRTRRGLPSPTTAANSKRTWMRRWT